MKDFFKPEDFSKYASTEMQEVPYGFCKSMADLTNEKLGKLIESWPVVYSSQDANKDYFEWSKDNYPGAQVQARLAFIEEIKKECPVHVPELQFFITGDSVETKCKHCGIPLQATWSEKC